MKGGFSDIVLAVYRLDCFATIGLPQDADDLFGAVLFLFHLETP